MKRIALLAGLAALPATPVFAHPGHGASGGSNSLLHFFTEPEHVGLALLAVFAIAAIRALARRRAR
jgi:hypothetical protein